MVRRASGGSSHAHVQVRLRLEGELHVVGELPPKLERHRAEMSGTQPDEREIGSGRKKATRHQSVPFTRRSMGTVMVVLTGAKHIVQGLRPVPVDFRWISSKQHDRD